MNQAATMSDLVPIREVARRRILAPTNERWVSELEWVPLSHTEFHLCSRYFPIAARIIAGKPCLGVIVGERFLARPLTDAAGHWQGAYKPIALRCFPFHVRDIGAEPLDDLLIARDGAFLSDREGTPLVDDNGRPTQAVVEIHRMFRVLHEARAVLAPALDQLLIGNFLMPMAARADADPQFYVVDRDRFLHADKTALAAMARQRFLGVDIAVAGLFSEELLRREFLPKPLATAAVQKMPAVSAAPVMRPIHELIGIDDFALVLDDGELISLADMETMRVEARQPPSPSVSPTAPISELASTSRQAGRAARQAQAPTIAPEPAGRPPAPGESVKIATIPAASRTKDHPRSDRKGAEHPRTEPAMSAEPRSAPLSPAPRPSERAAVLQPSLARPETPPDPRRGEPAHVTAQQAEASKKTPASETEPGNPAPADRQPDKAATGQQSSEAKRTVSPQISDMIRKLNDLQALLRLD